MTMVERTPYHGDEIQLFELSPEEVRQFNRKDNVARQWSIVKWWAWRLFEIVFLI